jgi:hypothetical protein
MDNGTPITTVWQWGVAHPRFVVLFFLAGGGPLLVSPFLWVYDQLPYRRRELAAQTEREAVEATQHKQEKAEAEKHHRESCSCGSECDGFEKCERHHRDCNCNHRSVCVCEVEQDCDCECRCNCRGCDGFRKPGPLARLHAESGGTETPAAASVPEPAATASTPREAARPSWGQALAQWSELCQQYAAYECDPHELLRLPALADVTFGPTATFIEAFYQAQQLVTDHEPEDSRRSQRFVDAAVAATSAWTVAREAANRVRASRYTEDEQALLRRALSALDLAKNDPDTGERDQGNAVAARMMQDLAKRAQASGRWRISDNSMAQIEALSRRELNSGPSTT